MREDEALVALNLFIMMIPFVGPAKTVCLDIEQCASRKD